MRAKQKLQFYAALASGVSWTFMSNTWFIIFLVRLILQDFKVIVEGGDDSAIEIKSDAVVDYDEAARFSVATTEESNHPAWFIFHSMIVTESGVFPDVVKLTTKVVEKRFNAKSLKP